MDKLRTEALLRIAEALEKIVETLTEMQKEAKKI